MDKDKQKQLIIEMMRVDEELGLYDLSEADVELIFKTCENLPKSNEALKKALEKYKKI